MEYNKITLSFSEELEKKFLERYFRDSVPQIRLSMILGAIIYGMFGYLDSLLFPDFAKLFHTIRFLFVIPMVVLVYALSYTKYFEKIWQFVLFICLIIAGSGISTMIMLLPNNSEYLSGMMLIFSAGYFFIKLRFFYATMAGWIILMIYNIGAVYFAKRPTELIINTNFFFISANIIGMFAAYSIELFARRNFFLNLALDKEKLIVEESNKNLEAIIEERTNELLLAKEIAETNSANVTAIIEGTQSSIWALNRNYEILYINHVFQTEFEQTFGVKLLPGTSLVDSLPEVLRTGWKARYDRVLGNEQFTIEDAVDSGYGMIYIQVSFNPILNKGKVIGASCFGSNITERKLFELELQKAKDRAEESDRLKSAFLANMSHEIRTPMNGILGFSELLKNPELSGEEQQEYLGIIEKSGERMLNIINDIIDISKIEAGLMKLDIGKACINDIVEYVYNFFRPELELKSIGFSFHTSMPKDESFIYTDNEKVHAVLINLVKNAVKYTDEGIIDFGYEKKDKVLEFYVRDTGIGIPVLRQEAIFERFIQADIIDKMARQGAGLGLSISRAYIDMLGGKIWVESIEGKGSVFYFTLPYNTNNSEGEISTELTKQQPEKDHTPKVPGLKILIAEDDEASELLLTLGVKKISREILKAKTGAEAVKIARKNSDLDLILMDIQMPELNGYDAAREIRTFNRNVVIIAQTAYGLTSDREKAIDAGCDDYISKPVRNDDLHALIHKYFK
jgi:signal transduction histidine kinase/CheY-like chemotaxis protein